MFIHLVLLLTITLLASCGGGGGDSAPAPTKKVTSIWSDTDGSSIMDLRSVTLGAPASFNFINENEAVLCECDATLTGTNFAGTYTLDCSTCSAPYNSIVLTNGSYSVSGSNVATFCDVAGDSTTCATYN